MGDILLRFGEDVVGPKTTAKGALLKMNKLLYLKLVVHREARDFDMRDQGDTYVAIGEEVSQCTATVPGSIGDSGDPSMYERRTMYALDQELWLGENSTVPERHRTLTEV
eukprot:m.409693 g.409693  ORF g.409693 m.409693 type:complete len:110 (+) comp28457_c0_seq7:143-472(+)